MLTQTNIKEHMTRDPQMKRNHFDYICLLETLKTDYTQFKTQIVLKV